MWPLEISWTSTSPATVATLPRNTVRSCFVLCNPSVDKRLAGVKEWIICGQREREDVAELPLLEFLGRPWLPLLVHPCSPLPP